MKNKSTRVRKFRGYAPVRRAAGTIGLEKGFGPLHAANSLEGTAVDPLQEKVLKLQGGSDDAPKRPLTRAELEKLPEWMRDMVKGIPWKEGHPGRQYDPADVPVQQGAHGRYYDPRYSAKEDLVLEAAGGNSNVPKGFTQFWPGGGKWEGPGHVAAGSDILGGQPWQYYDIGNPNAPWIGLEGPRGSLGQWVDIPGENRRGRVIDVKQQGYGGYGILQRGRYDRHGNLIPGSGGEGGGGGDQGRIRRGPFSGWSPGQFNEWHSGAGPSQLNYPSFTGTTAGPGGQNLAFETTSYNVPGYGWVPRAQLANAQASNNFWDYMNPFGHTSQGGPNTGDPTQRNVGRVVGTISNFFIPGIGYVTGPIARWAMSKIQGGMSKGDVGRAVAQAHAQGKLPPMPSGSVDLPQGDTSTSGGGQDWGGLGKQMGYFPYWQPGRTGSSSYAPFTGGVWGGGGTLAGGGIRQSDIAASGVTPRSVQSVQAPSGGYSPMGFSGPSNLNWGGGWEGGDRPHFNPYFGGYSLDKPAGTPVALKAKGDSDVDERDLGPMLDKWTSGLSAQELKVLGPLFGEFLLDREVRSKMKVGDLRPDLLGESELGRRHAADTLPDFSAEPQYTQDSPALQGAARWRLPGYKKGKHTVQAVQGNTDTVPAMLTPREAVLNRNAAELAGRGNIEQLNAEGNKLAEKGVDLAGGKNMKTKKMQGGGYVSDANAKLKNQPITTDANQPAYGYGMGSGGPNKLNQAQQNYQNMTGFLPPALTGGTFSGGKWTGGAGQVPPASMPGAYGPPQGGVGGMPSGANLNQAQQNYFNRYNQLPPALGGGPQPHLPYKLQGGGFYPQGIGMQGGTQEVPPGPIGSPNPQTAYGPPITLTAPQLQQAAQKAGLSGGQIQGLMSAVQGFGQGYNELTGGAGSAADMATAASGSYQGGISDIGYPPFVAPQAEYHADKGSSWIGRYDPNYMISVC